MFRSKSILTMMLLACAAMCAAGQTSPPRSMPGQKGPSRGNSKARIVPRGVTDKSIKPQQTVILPPLPAGLIEELKKQDAAEGRSQRVRLGFGRPFEHPIIVRGETNGGWTTTADGAHVYAIQITSEGALGMRVHLENVKLPLGAQIMAYDPATSSPQVAPITAKDITPEGDVWMPSVLAETVVLECDLPPGAEVSAASFSVTGLSHFYQPLVRVQPKAQCELDVVCYPLWANEAAGVAEIIFVEGMDTFQCTGSLMNDSDPSTFINYFLTAHHCIGSQTVAATIDFYWFFQDISCDGPQDPGTQTSGGADLLATSSTSDFAFLRLRRDPPDGVYYLGWSTETPSMTENLTGIHHPQGEPTKISFGGLWGVQNNFWQVQWSQGVTEEGSSGSALFNSSHLIVGQLYGGASSCINPSGVDFYGRFDKTFRSLARWLSPSGSYNGLFAESGGVAVESSGFVNIRLQGSGAFTAAFFLAGKRYGFAGQFASDNTASKVINRGGAPALTINLTLDTSSANQITGTISDGAWTADLTAPHAGFDRKLNPAPWQGNYTVVFPGQTSDPSLPAGNGYGRAAVDASGNVRLTASLADRTAFSQSVPLSSGGDWPLYGSLNAGKGEVWSWMLFDTNRPNDDINGSVTWIKKAQTTRFYPGGFTNVSDAIGSFYQRPTNSSMQVLGLTSATVSFTGGNLPSGFSDQITIGANNRVTNGSTNRLTMAFAPATGLFTGNVTPPGMTRGFGFSGAVLQKQSTGYGYLVGTNETSGVAIGQ
jgi:hypothetical protein